MRRARRDFGFVFSPAVSGLLRGRLWLPAGVRAFLTMTPDQLTPPAV